MKNKVFAVLAVVAISGLVVALAGCSGGGGGGGGTYAANWVTPAVTGTSVSVPLSAVNARNNVHFRVNGPQGPMGFVAYQLNGQTQVRARLCVPCRGESFTLKGNTLVCDTCGTTFSAVSGKGIGGVAACQSYAKVASPFTTSADGNIVMNLSDLQTAYDKTLKRAQ